jgi:hypothetical protein
MAAGDGRRRQREAAMRKLWMALVTVAALTIGAAWAEGVNDGKGNADKSHGADSACCCCCARSCAK